MDAKHLTKVYLSASSQGESRSLSTATHDPKKSCIPSQSFNGAVANKSPSIQLMSKVWLINF